jgi:hypothetical protein
MDYSIQYLALFTRIGPPTLPQLPIEIRDEALRE